MKITLVMIIIGVFLPFFASADQFQFGAGIDTSLLSYNQDEIDGSRVLYGKPGYAQRGGLLATNGRMHSTAVAKLRC